MNLLPISLNDSHGKRTSLFPLCLFTLKLENTSFKFSFSQAIFHRQDQFVVSMSFSQSQSLSVNGAFRRIVTVRNKVAKAMFLHLSVIMFTGGVCLSACWDSIPRTRYPPGSRRLLLRTVRILLECILVRPAVSRHPRTKTFPVTYKGERLRNKKTSRYLFSADR